MSTCSQKWKIYIYHVLRHVLFIIRPRLNEFLPRSQDDTGCARIVFRGWPSSWSESKQFENCLHFFNLLSANYNNFWSTYQYYEVWRQSNHEVWRTLSKLLHQFLNLDIVTANREGPAYLGVIRWRNHMRYARFMLDRTRKPTIFTLIRIKVPLSWEHWTPRPLLTQKFWEGKGMIRLILTRGNKTLQN